MRFWRCLTCLAGKQNVGLTLPYIAVVFAFGLWNLAAARNHCRPKDCHDLKCYGLSEGKDGPHTIYPDTPDLTSLDVSCDQETDDGGWIIYQRRVNGTLNFTRNWEEYKRGFGNNGGNTTELWLGNENVYQLLQSFGNKVVDLRIEGDAFNGLRFSIESDNFRMDNEAALYRIDWDSSRVNAPTDAKLFAARWDKHKKYAFETFDKHDGNNNCLRGYKG